MMAEKKRAKKAEKPKPPVRLEEKHEWPGASQLTTPKSAARSPKERATEQIE